MKTLLPLTLLVIVLATLAYGSYKWNQVKDIEYTNETMYLETYCQAANGNFDYSTMTCSY